MKYRVRVDLPFDNESDAIAFMTQCKVIIAKSTSINEDAMNAEIANIYYEKCYHDETPTKPCEVLEKQEVRKGQVVVLKEAKAMER